MTRQRLAVLMTLLLALTGFSVPAGGAGKAPAPAVSVTAITDANQNKVFDNLEAAMAQAGPKGVFDVLVQVHGSVEALLTTDLAPAVAGAEIKAQWDVAVQGFAATLSTGQIQALLQSPAVQQVELDMPVTTFLDGAHRWTGVNQARADFDVTGDRDGASGRYSATDVTVAVIDTGIDASHVDLDGGKVIGWYDVIQRRSQPYDDNGHGTHVASMIAGTGEGNSSYKGVAPGAALIGIKVLSGAGSGSMSGIISGINWMIDNRARYGIRVANMSLGAAGCSDGTDTLSQAVNNAVTSGIVMAVAAGNSGPAKCTVGSPAAAAKAITVGAAYDPAELGWVLAEFSSRGPTADGRVKPDIVTPGRYITAAKANSSNGYVTYSGTSMATPYAAGIIALMLDANYGLADDGIKSILYGSTGTTDWGPAGKDSDWGYGIVRGYDAINAAGGFNSSWSDGLVHKYNSGRLYGSGDRQSWRFTVNSTSAPVGITLVMPDWAGPWGYPDFDMYVFDPSGAQVAAALGVKRQEQLQFNPEVTGTYTLTVYSYWGAGPYWFDISLK